VSNIRAQGLCAADAADKLVWLMAAARRLGASGVGLKDESSGAPGRIEDAA
jgi:ethanolamine ammonia-lyase small subunit